MPVTQKDIAEKLRLSRSLVGAVLNDKAGEWVSEETRQRILKAAVEMQYRPHAAARALRSGKTQTVAFHFFPPPPWGRSLTGSMIETLAEELAAWNYRLIVSVAGGRTDEAFESLVTGRCCDAIVLSGVEAQIEPLAERLEREGMPFIAVGDFLGTHPAWAQIDFDHEAMMEQSVEHLTALGHSRIGYLGHDNDQSYSVRLLTGFQEAVQRRGSLVHAAFAVRTGSTYSTGEAVNLWLAMPEEERPTAVVVGTPDVLAWRDLEISLALYGRSLGDGPGDFGAVGLSEGEHSLFFGAASAFRLTDRTDMTERVVRDLLGPLLRDEPIPNPIVRFLPSLEPLSSNRLQAACAAL